MIISSIFSSQNNALTNVLIFFEEKVIAKTRIAKCTYCPLKNESAKYKAINLHLNLMNICKCKI